MPRLLARPWVHSLSLRLGVPVLYGIYRLIGLTLRRSRRGTDAEMYRQVREGRRFLIAFWHSDIFLMALEMRNVLAAGNIHILASESRDGDYVARFLELAGARMARGSTGRGGGRALLQMTRRIAPRDFAAIAVDGPRGPRQEVQKGILVLAKRSGLPIVPLAAHPDNAWVLRSWDRMEIPKPFSRTAVVYGEPLEVPPDAGPEALEDLRTALEDRLRTLKTRGDIRGRTDSR